MPADPGARPPSTDWTPPEQFDGFLVVRPLGRGGMGHVYLGHDPMLDRAVALKFIAAESPAAIARERFLVEARGLARLAHPNVVGIYRVGEVSGRPYIAYELVSGLTVDRMTRPLPWQRALAIGVGVARGLAAAHKRDVLHRDVKPGNIILAGTGEVKLIDFGLAKLVDPDGVPALPPSIDESVDESVRVPEGAEIDTGEAATMRAPPLIGDTGELRAARAPGPGQALTVTGALLGTPLYIAPELWLGHTATVQSDVYALGLVLYELLAGALPHADLRGMELVRAVASRDLPPLASLCPGLPAAFGELVDRCVRRRREERCRTADEVRDALEVIQSLYEPFTGAAPAGGDALFSEEEASNVAASFARIASQGDRLAVRMYERLFAIEPSVRRLFPNEMAHQRVKLMGALHVIVQNLRRPDRMLPLLQDLGRRHAAYGVVPSHFEAVGQALMGALVELDAGWDGPLERAWSRAYGTVAEAMRRGLESEAQTLDPLPLSDLGSDADVPRTRYARSGDVNLAYQVVGSGTTPLLLMQGWVTNLEAGWQSPEYARFLRTLGSVARVIVFDKRGTGLSDRVAGAPSLEQQTADACAVLDAASAGAAVILGTSGGVAPAVHLAATRPDRAGALIAYGGGARTTAAPGYPHGVDQAVIDARLRAIDERWGEALFLDDLAPSRAADAAFGRFWAAYLRSGAGPGSAADLLRVEAACDVRAELAAVRAPSLVLQRAADAWAPKAAARHLVEHLAGAAYVELTGADHLPFASDPASIARAIEAFLDAGRLTP